MTHFVADNSVVYYNVNFNRQPGNASLIRNSFYSKSNYILHQKVGDISLTRNHAPLSRVLEKFLLDKHGVLLLAHGRFISSSSVA